MPAVPNQGVHRFAIFTACCTVILLTAGALVTSNDAGLAVPDWPLSYGSLMPPMIGGIFYEHGHRMIATLVGILTIVLAVWLSLVEPRRWVRRLGWAALGLVVAQGLLGGLTVLFYLPPAVSSAHATLAQLYFITVLSLAVFTSRWWQSDLEVREDAGSPPIRMLAVATTVSIVVQLILGAAFRHNLFGIVPHLVGAGVATGLVIWTGIVVKKRFRDFRPLRRAMILL
ncbi:MAG: COX15/CtaA family protein, partial [Candidatus Acidiferrales bacterium]